MTLIYYFSKLLNKLGPHNNLPFALNEDGADQMELHLADPMDDDYQSDSDDESLISDTDDDSETNEYFVCFNMINNLLYLFP